MKEFKFRVYNQAHNKMYYDDIELPCSENVDLNTQIEELLDRGYILSKCLFLKDKNGQELYTGDIIDFGDVYCEEYQKYVVVDKNLFYLCENITDSFPLHEIQYDFTIIGNKFENPELYEKVIGDKL